MDNFIATIPMRDITRFCQLWKIQELAVFGSALPDDFHGNSDVDILVTFKGEAEWGLLGHVRMQQELQALIHRDVDLITRRALEHSPNWLRRSEIVTTAQVVFSERKPTYATDVPELLSKLKPLLPREDTECQ